MLTTVVIVLAVVLGLSIAIGTRPDNFRIERFTTITAPADVVFGYMNDFRRWSHWSPFETLDAKLTRTFTGAASGAGAVYSWVGKKAGEGTMTIRRSTPGRSIVIDMQFRKPFKATNVTEFTLTPTADGVSVHWTTSGENTAVAKVLSLVVNMDKLLGNDFEKGLASLKAVSESAERQPASLAS